MVIFKVGLASAGLVVAQLENLFTFRAQPKKTRDVTVLVAEFFTREKKNAAEEAVHPQTGQTQNNKTDET